MALMASQSAEQRTGPSPPGVVCMDSIRGGGGGGGGSGGVPQRGRLFKFDFPSAKFWVKFFWGGWISEPKDAPPSYKQSLPVTSGGCLILSTVM